MRSPRNIFTAAALFAGFTMRSTTFASPVDFVSLLSQLVIDKRIASPWTPLGCWSDDRYHRTLTSLAALEDVSADTCMNECFNTGFVLAGVEYGDECWCDYNVQGTTKKVAESYCNFHCSGNAQEACGGDLVIDIYSYSPTASMSVSVTATSISIIPTVSAVTMPGAYIYLGCYTDSRDSRSLEIAGDFPGASQGMTIKPCQGACQNAGYFFAGVEFGHECWCDNGIRGSGVSVTGNECDMPCSGNVSETCGGSNRINVYAFVAITTTATSISAPYTSTTPTSTASASSTSVCTMYYQVVSGEYYYDIWTRFRISQEQFASWNPSLVWPEPLIVPSQMLCVQQGPQGSSLLTVSGLPPTPA